MSLLVAESLLFAATPPCLFEPATLFLLPCKAEAGFCLLAVLGITAGQGGSNTAWGLVRGLIMGLLVLLSSRPGSGRPLRLVQARWANLSRACRIGEATEKSSCLP